VVPHGLAARALMNTVFREYEVDDDDIAVVGAAARWERVIGDPMAGRCWRIIQESRWARDIKLQGMADLLARGSSPDVIARIGAKAKDPSSRMFNSLRSLATSLGSGDFLAGLESSRTLRALVPMLTRLEAGVDVLQAEAAQKAPGLSNRDAAVRLFRRAAELDEKKVQI
jgi:hypothetical protein